MCSKSALRPDIPSINSEQCVNASEQFQNEVLRPILKLQNDLLLQLFINYTYSKNKHFNSLKKEQKLLWITNVFSKDIAFKNQVIGLVLGLLETKELEIYLQDKSVLHKRILQMSKQRVRDNLNLS